MKKAYLVRFGAFGDNIIITPVIRELKRLGYYVMVETSERGVDVFKYNPNIDEVIEYKRNSIPMDKLEEYWETTRKKVNPQYYKNFSESIEEALSITSRNPLYCKSKEERRLICNRNFYEFTREWSGLNFDNLKPELFFSDEEKKTAEAILEKGKFNLVWGLSGSGKNKCYPYVQQVVDKLLKKYGDILHIITVGDEACKILSIEDKKNRVINMSGIIPMRIALCLTGLCDLVVSPDTGLLHGSGCYPTPKLGILGHTTVENITKHFDNDYSIESTSSCSPCFKLIYDNSIQCPCDNETLASLCMSKGQLPERITHKISGVIEKWKNN